MAGRLYGEGNVKHTQMIADLCGRTPGMQTRLFWRSVDALTEELDFFEPVRHRPFLPDAFRINRETCELEIHEVVRTNDLTERKLLLMGALWGEFDGEQDEWYPVLFVHREGFEPRRMELFDWYLKTIRAAAQRIAAGPPPATV